MTLGKHILSMKAVTTCEVKVKPWHENRSACISFRMHTTVPESKTIWFRCQDWQVLFWDSSAC